MLYQHNATRHCPGGHLSDAQVGNIYSRRKTRRVLGRLVRQAANRFESTARTNLTLNTVRKVSPTGPRSVRHNSGPGAEFGFLCIGKRKWSF